jgi:hypothetical protein
MGHDRDRSIPVGPEMIGNRADGQREVGTGVAVGYRKHVDPVQLGSLALRMLTRSEQGPSEARSIQIRYLHRFRRFS